MTGRMIAFDAAGAPAPGYLATPDAAVAPEGPGAPGVVVLHAWWGLTAPFRQVCDRLAAAGFLALAPDLYRGKTATTVEEAEALAATLNQHEERVRGDLRGAVQFLRQHEQQAAPDAPSMPSMPSAADGGGTVALIGFSLGGAYALDLSVTLAEEVAAVVIFYGTYPGLAYGHAHAAYLGHFAADDPFEPAESVAALEQELRAAGRPVTVFTYPGTTHWFFEANRPDAYDAEAAALAWERTLAFLNTELRRA
jgi:carboxymethylenebutenolidase